MILGSDPIDSRSFDPEEFFDEIYTTEDGEELIHKFDRLRALNREDDSICC